MATINGTNSNDTLNGTSSADAIDALAGNDTVNGGDGNDTITGGTGYDQVTGGAGADVFVFRLNDGINTEPHDAIMDFQVGVDRVQFASGGVTGFENDPEGIWVNYGSSDNSWFQLRGVQSITAAQLTGSGGGTSPPPPPPPPTGGGGTTPPPPTGGPTSGNDNLTGTAGADTIDALAGNDTVNGGDGNDTITGGTGYDQVTGGAGADVFVFRLNDGINTEPHDAIMDFQVGVDRVQFASGGVTGFENDPEGIWVNYGSSDNSWFQLRGVQSITAAQLTGSGGGTSPPPPPPPPTGGGGTTPPPPTGGPTSGNDALTGTAGADTIDALAGNDTVNGGDGNDTITGGTGYDQVTGGAGADVFVFRLNDGINTEPHDAIMDFQVGVDRVQFASGGVIGFENDPAGIWVNYGSSDNSWFQLRGVQSITAAQLTGSGGGGTNPPPPPPPPPPTGGGAPYPRGVAPTYAEEFTTGWGSWSHNWQSEEGIQQTGNGTIRIGGSSNPGSGLMYQNPNSPAAGFGDGLYEFRARMEGPGLGNGSGPALVLWPGDDRWPGPEIDIGEIGGGGDLYMATHWNNNGQDAYNIYSAPGVDWRQWHNYAARLENNRITYYVDGQQIGVETQHPAPEYGEGGVNHVPSVMNRSSETMIEVDYFRFTDESALV